MDIENTQLYYQKFLDLLDSMSFAECATFIGFVWFTTFAMSIIITLDHIHNELVKLNKNIPSEPNFKDN